MRWRHWLRLGRLTRDEREQDIEREIRAHLELEAEDQRDAGITAEDARYAAKRAFGNRALIAEDIRAIWGTPSLDALHQDLRYALRTMRRAPAFAAIAVGSSALGIGACSVIFAILNFAVLTPLPVDEPGRLMSLSEIDRRSGEAGSVLSYPDFRDLRQARSFMGIAAFNSLLSASIGSQGDPQRRWGALVTANYFEVVKPRFAVGRGFDADRDDAPGEPPVVVLSHDLWQTGFGGDPGIVGRTVPINKRAATVIGVTEAGFRGTDVGIVSEFWIPFSMIDDDRVHSGPAKENRQRYWLGAVARLRDGVDVQAAHAELDVIARTLNSTFARDESRGFHLERAGQINPGLRRMALTFFSLSLGATALVLLTACANVANLLLGRASGRKREMAARMALGASRGRLVRQLLTESLVLALLGGAGGWIIAAYGASLMGLTRTPFGWPLDLSVSLDYRVLLFCIGLSIVTGVVFGLVPALRATKSDLVSDLKVDPRGDDTVNRFGLRNGLVVAQMAICTLLLLCMGLFLRGLQTARGLDVGLSNRNLLLLDFDPALDRRPDPQARQLLRDILERAHAAAGVESATLTTAVPLTLIISNSSFVPEENAADPNRQRIRTDIYAVGPRFFETMGISFLAGDDFRFDQGATEGIAIVNEAFVRAAFPNQSALRQSSGQSIGRRVLGDGKRLQIVGVVATAKSRRIDEDPRPSIYLPILNEYAGAETLRAVTLIVKTRGAAAATYAGPMREAVRRADPALAVFDVRTMESHLADALLVPRLAWVLSAITGGIGLVIATIGVYGVISFAVARRRREIGIRLAVGARPREVLMMIVKQGITLAFIGTVLGLLAGLSVTRFAASLLYGVNPRDTITFVAVPLLLTFVALLACLLPARAAARVDPVDVLRSE
jgi:putative ABC transport system permease protein